MTENLTREEKERKEEWSKRLAESRHRKIQRRKNMYERFLAYKDSGFKDEALLDSRDSMIDINEFNKPYNILEKHRCQIAIDLWLRSKDSLEFSDDDAWYRGLMYLWDTYCAIPYVAIIEDAGRPVLDSDTVRKDLGIDPIG